MEEVEGSRERERETEELVRWLPLSISTIQLVFFSSIQLASTFCCSFLHDWSSCVADNASSIPVEDCAGPPYVGGIEEWGDL